MPKKKQLPLPLVNNPSQILPYNIEDKSISSDQSIEKSQFMIQRSIKSRNEENNQVNQFEQTSILEETQM